MPIEVLFVDDQLDSAKSYAEHVKRRTRLTTAYTDSQEEALQILQAHPVKVVVLDQRMESGERLKTRGTKLFKEVIYEHDPRIRCLIFSGQAQSGDHDEIHRHFGRVKFLNKSDAEDLPGWVQRLFQEYDEELFDEFHTRDPLGEHHSFWPFPPTVRYRLLTEESIGEPEYSADDYESVVEVHAGESVERRTLHAAEGEIHLEEETVDQLQRSGALSVSILKELRVQLSNSARKRTKAIRRSRSEEETTTLETVSEEDRRRGVIVRRVEQAPYYRRKRAIVLVDCSCCGNERTLIIPFRESTGQVHRRQTYVFDDHRTETINL